VHQQRRYDKDFNTSKAVFESGALGDVYTVQSSLYGFNGNMHDWHVFKDQGGGMLYDWGVHLIDQILYMIPGKIVSVYADMRNVINDEVDDYFNIMLNFECGVSARIELGTYFLSDKPNWFERHWFIGGNKGTMYSDGFDPKGKIVRTSELLTAVSDGRTMTSAGPTRSFGPPPEGRILTESLPQVDVNHRMFFDNYLSALNGKSEFLVKISEVRRVLCLMDAVRESAASRRSVNFED
jgi:predicted dehydrogenase